MNGRSTRQDIPITADIISGQCHFRKNLSAPPWQFALTGERTEIPLFQRSVDIAAHGSSAWARSYRVTRENDEGESESYFMKVGNIILACFSLLARATSV